MASFPVGDNVFLRALEPSDIDLIYKWENDVNAWKVSYSLTPYSKYLLNKYLENAHLDIYEVKQLRLMIAKNTDNYPIGTIELFDFDPFHLRAGVGLMIHELDEQKKGFGFEALKLIIDYSFFHLGLHQIYCNIAADNETSLNLFQKSGFEIIGKKKDWIKNLNKGWIDEYSLQLINKI
jgi:diamine N-acetyltransferase